MEQINWMIKPLLTNPVAIIAFEGWSDAANIASGCIEHLSCNYDVEPFAELNSENFYNFQMRRPVIEIQGIGDRRFHWPQTSFYAIENFSKERDADNAIKFLKIHIEKGLEHALDLFQDQI